MINVLLKKLKATEIAIVDPGGQEYINTKVKNKRVQTHIPELNPETLFSPTILLDSDIAPSSN